MDMSLVDFKKMEISDMIQWINEYIDLVDEYLVRQVGALLVETFIIVSNEEFFVVMECYFNCIIKRNDVNNYGLLLVDSLFNQINKSNIDRMMNLFRGVISRLNVKDESSFSNRIVNIKVCSNSNYLMTGELLGKGHTGSVRKAIHMTSGEIVAIKIIQLSEHQNMLPKLEREIKILKHYCSSKIITLIDNFNDNQNLYQVLEYCPHGDLENYLHEQFRVNKTIDEMIIYNIMKEIRSAMRFLRAKDITHRDIKPANILIYSNKGGKLQLKLCDFAFAKSLRSGQLTRTILGSPHYSAPEIQKGNSYGPEVDLWSVGAILYFMLTGCEIVDNTKINFPDGGDPNTFSLLTRLLKYSPKERINFHNYFSHSYFKKKDKTLLIENENLRSKNLNLMEEIENLKIKIEELESQKNIYSKDELSSSLRNEVEQLKKENQTLLYALLESKIKTVEVQRKTEKILSNLLEDQ